MGRLTSWAKGPLGSAINGGSSRGLTASISSAESRAIPAAEAEANLRSAGSGFDPVAFLAAMMDLRGSLVVAGQLDATEFPAPAPDMTASAAEESERLRATVAYRFEEFEGIYGRTIASRSQLPPPAKLHGGLETHGILTDRSARNVRAFASTLFLPISDAFGARVAGLRTEARELRREIGAELKAKGGRLARLERLDAALEVACHQRTDQLIFQLIRAVDKSFAADVARAVARLHPEPTVDEVAAWVSAGGCIRRACDATRDAVVAVIDFERVRFDALALAVSEEGA